MSGPRSLGVEYLSRAQLPLQSNSWWDSVLGLAHFGLQPIAGSPKPIPVSELTMAPLVTADGVCEVWRADGPKRNGRIRAVQYRASEQLLYGCVSVPESIGLNGGSDHEHSPLELATIGAYRDIFATLDALAYPQLVRIWNYVPAINEDALGGERYWQFNKARQESFLSRKLPIVDNVPAGSALGTPTGSPLVIYFLASRVAMRAIENPRQVSAYHYPSQYGPKSPTFSRAALLTEPAGDTLLVSGTASIIGHKSVHTDDVAAQTRETIANINTLIAEANRLSEDPRHATDMLAYKVYVRNPQHLPTIAAELRAAIGQRATVTYLQADVCRRELLVEIEAASSRNPTEH
ncbi:MAG: hypothetical protein ACLPQI_06735 [Steroidobacteraceae bacterium]